MRTDSLSVRCNSFSTVAGLQTASPPSGDLRERCGYRLLLLRGFLRGARWRRRDRLPFVEGLLVHPVP